jgi:hypothetical protein
MAIRIIVSTMMKKWIFSSGIIFPYPKRKTKTPQSSSTKFGSTTKKCSRLLILPRQDLSWKIPAWVEDGMDATESTNTLSSARSERWNMQQGWNVGANATGRTTTEYATLATGLKVNKVTVAEETDITRLAVGLWTRRWKWPDFGTTTNASSDRALTLLVEHVGTSATETPWSKVAADAKYAMVHRRVGGNKWDIAVGETDTNLHVPQNIKTQWPLEGSNITTPVSTRQVKPSRRQ